MGGTGLSVSPGRDATIPLLARLPRSARSARAAGDSTSISLTPIAVRGGSDHLGPPTVTSGYRGLLPTLNGHSAWADEGLLDCEELSLVGNLVAQR